MHLKLLQSVVRLNQQCALLLRLLGLILQTGTVRFFLAFSQSWTYYHYLLHFNFAVELFFLLLLFLLFWLDCHLSLFILRVAELTKNRRQIWQSDGLFSQKITDQRVILGWFLHKLLPF